MKSSTPRPTLGLVLLAALSGHGCVHGWLPRAPQAGGQNVALRYEGTCADLACCSRYGVAVAAHTPGAFACESRDEGDACSQGAGWYAPGFTCDPHTQHRYRQPDDPPYLTCNDSDRWLSLPDLTRAECGESLLVCHRGVRVIAFVRDRSAPNGSGNAHIEGSLGLLRAIGADPGDRETIVSVYALHERERIAADPHCVGDAPPRAMGWGEGSAR